MTKIAFVNGKGGVGKTTSAMLLAAALQDAGQRVSIDDRDPQRSATTACAVFGIPLGDAANIVLLDTAPNIEHPGTVDAIRTADLVLLITTPSPLDLATTAATARMIQGQRTGSTRVLFNRVQTNNRFFAEMAEIAKDLPFPSFKNYLAMRTPYQTAQLMGWRALAASQREEVTRVATEVALALP